jgi:hypothetical protein
LTGLADLGCRCVQSAGQRTQARADVTTTCQESAYATVPRATSLDTRP